MELKVLKLPRKCFLGDGALEQALPNICKNGKKALIVTGNSMIKQGHVEILKKQLIGHDVESFIYTGVTGEPTDEMVENGVSTYKTNRCDFIIGFGGGSQMDTAKAVGAMCVHEGKISDYNGKEFTYELPPIIEIPSTAGTGSEATAVTIISDTKQNIKMLLKGSVLLPRIAVVDPCYTYEMPPQITAWSGLDALTHAIEAYTSKHAFPACDEYAVSAIKRIFVNLPLAYNDGKNYKAREEMSLAAYEAGVTICNSTVTLVHGMSRPIGALFHVPHGLSNAMLLKECLSFAVDGAENRFAILARAIGVAGIEEQDKEAAKLFILAIENLCDRLQVPSLKAYGINQVDFEAQIPKMAKDAADSGSPANTRKAVTVKDMEIIYRSLW